MTNCKYPRTIISIGRGSSGKEQVTLACDTMITPIEDFANCDSPLKIYRKGSGIRLNFAKTDSNGHRDGGSGNIEVTKLADVRLRTQIAMQDIMQTEANRSTDQGQKAHCDLLQTMITYLPLNMSNGKRKSAMEVAKMYPYENIAIAVKMLEEQAKKNPAYAAQNQKQAEALHIAAEVILSKQLKLNGETVYDLCKDAKKAITEVHKLPTSDPVSINTLALFTAFKKHNGLYAAVYDSQSSSSNLKTFVIYEADMKTPSNTSLDKDGLAKAYSLKITACAQRLPYPFHVELSTWRGHPAVGRNVGLQDEVKGTRRNFSIDLTTDEWNAIVEEAFEEKNITRMLYHTTAYRAMEAAEQANIAASASSRVS